MIGTRTYFYFVFSFFILTLLFIPHFTLAAVTDKPLTGWAWSDNVGWISFNCSTGGVTGGNICGTSNYAVNQTIDGNLTGWAWSESVGWISFTPSVNSLNSTCPYDPADNGNCAARVSTTTGTLGNVYGWARAIAGCQSDLWNGLGVKCTGNGPGVDNGVTSSTFIPTTRTLTWSMLTLPDAGLNLTAVSSSATGQYIVVAASLGHIYLSSDYGATWITTTASLQDWTSIACSSDCSYIFATTRYGNVYVSSNRGVSWTAKGIAPNAGTQGWTSIASSATGQYVVASVFSGNTFVSNNYGSTWTASAAGSNFWKSVAISSTGQRMAVVAWYDSSAAHISSDYGATWGFSGSGGPLQDPSSIGMSSDGSKLAEVVWNGGSAYVSNNSGASWSASALPASDWESMTSSDDGKYLVAVDSYGSVYVSSNSGSSWTATSPGGYITTSNSSALTSSSDGLRIVLVSTTGQVSLGVYSSLLPVTTLLSTGWDGWIHLSGARHPTGDLTGMGGVTFATTTGRLVGYAWGGDIIGWINFNASSTVDTHTPCDPNVSVCGPIPSFATTTVDLYFTSGFSSNATTLSTSTRTSFPTATLGWSTTNAVSCSPVTANTSTNPFGSSLWNGVTGGATSSFSIANIVGPFNALPVQNPITYSISCVGVSGLSTTSSAVLTLTTGTGFNNPSGSRCVPIVNATLCQNEGTSTPLFPSKIVSVCSNDPALWGHLCEFICSNGSVKTGAGLCVFPGTVQEK